jgi:hypothetical protein
MTAGFWRSSLSIVWQRQWWLPMAAIAVVVNGGVDGIELKDPMAVLLTVAAVGSGGKDGIFTTSYYDNDHHPCPLRPRPCLSWTRIGQRGGGCAVMHLICCCHGCHSWCHLCLHLRDDGAKDNSHSNRQGCNPNIHGQAEMGHHDPIGMEQQKQKQKQKQQQQQWRQHHRLYTCRQHARAVAAAAFA